MKKHTPYICTYMCLNTKLYMVNIFKHILRHTSNYIRHAFFLINNNVCLHGPLMSTNIENIRQHECSNIW